MSYVDKHKVQLYMEQHKNYFPEDKLTEIKERLCKISDEKFVNFIDFPFIDPKKAKILCITGIGLEQLLLGNKRKALYKFLVLVAFIYIVINSLGHFGSVEILDIGIFVLFLAKYIYDSISVPKQAKEINYKRFTEKIRNTY